MKKIMNNVRYGFNNMVLWASNHHRTYYLLCVIIGLFIGLTIVALNTTSYGHNVTYACNGKTVKEIVFDTNYGWSETTWRCNKYEYSGETIVGDKKVVECCFDIADNIYYYEIYGLRLLDIK